MHQLDRKLIEDLNSGHLFSIQTLTNVKCSHPVGTTASAATILFPHSTYVIVKWATLFSRSINVEMAVLVRVHNFTLLCYNLLVINAGERGALAERISLLDRCLG